jgi:hypothetical protein
MSFAKRIPDNPVSSVKVLYNFVEEGIDSIFGNTPTDEATNQ